MRQRFASNFLLNDFLAIFSDLPALTFDIELSSFPGVFLYVIRPKNCNWQWIGHGLACFKVFSNEKRGGVVSGSIRWAPLKVNYFENFILIRNPHFVKCQKFQGFTNKHLQTPPMAKTFQKLEDKGLL